MLLEVIGTIILIFLSVVLFLPQSDIAPETLRNSLVTSGALVDAIVTYKTIIPKDEIISANSIITSGTLDMVTFTSASTVSNLKAMLGGDMALLKEIRIASIGPITSQTVRDLGFEVAAEAEESCGRGHSEGGHSKN